MLTFFRRIRQGLLTDNRFSKYVLYALGEIILVVIGILIALQINNENEARKERRFEYKLLTEMKTALEKDIDFFNDHLIGFRMKRSRKAVAFFENYLITDSIDRDSIDYHFWRLSTGIQVTYNKGPYEALKSTGIDKLKNDSLRNQIIEFYEFYMPRNIGLVKIQEENSSEEIARLEDLLGEPLTVEVVDGKVRYNYKSMKKSIDLKTDPDFLLLLSWTSDRARTLTEMLERISEEMELIVAAIASELQQH